MIPNETEISGCVCLCPQPHVVKTKLVKCNDMELFAQAPIGTEMALWLLLLCPSIWLITISLYLFVISAWFGSARFVSSYKSCMTRRRCRCDLLFLKTIFSLSLWSANGAHFIFKLNVCVYLKTAINLSRTNKTSAEITLRISPQQSLNNGKIIIISYICWLNFSNWFLYLHF